MALRPTARTDSVIAENVGKDECVLYDLRTNRVHSLNRSLAWIWRHCNGSLTEAEMAAAMQAQLGCADAADIVAAGLEQLDNAGLLQPGEPVPLAPPPALSRRSLVLSGSAAAPILTSILAPTPAAAKSKDKGKGEGNGNGNGKRKSK